MKRGLVLLDPQEIPTIELESRVAKLQSKLEQQGIAAAFIYGDVHRSGDISYLSNICIYWNEGLLVVPSTGEAALLTKLSSRVHPWMRSVSNLQDLRSGGNLAELVIEYLRDVAPGCVGLVEKDWWPALLVDELQAKLPGWTLKDLGPVIQHERERPSESELKLLRKSAEISVKAVSSGMDLTLSNSGRAGKAELVARMAGVEDVSVFCHPATDEADTIEVMSEYRGYWTVAARVVSKGVPEWGTLILQAYEAAQEVLKAGVNVGALRGAVAAKLVVSDIPWRVDLIHHTALETSGDYRCPVEELSHVNAGSVVGIRLEFCFSDSTQAVIADTFLINKDGATLLTMGLPQVFFQA